MSESSSQKAIKDFILREVLGHPQSISSGELTLLRMQIKVKLSELAVQVQHMDDKATAEEYNSVLLTALSLKCIFGLANKIEKENETI